MHSDDASALWTKAQQGNLLQKCTSEKYQCGIIQRNLEDLRLEKLILVTKVLNVVHKPLHIHSLATQGPLFFFFKVNADYPNPIKYSKIFPQGSIFHWQWVVRPTVTKKCNQQVSFRKERRKEHKGLLIFIFYRILNTEQIFRYRKLYSFLIHLS